MRDPFVNYDQWLERPYQDQCDREAYAEWQSENTTAECGSCGHSFGPPDEVVLTLVEGETIRPFHTAMCPVCKEECEVNIIVPEQDAGRDDDDYEPPDRDEFYFTDNY